MSIPIGIKSRMFLYSLKGSAVKLLLSDGPASMVMAGDCNDSPLLQTVMREARDIREGRDPKFEIRSSEVPKTSNFGPRTLPPSSQSRPAILQDCSLLCHTADLEFLACQHCYSATCSRASTTLTSNKPVERVEAHSYILVPRERHGRKESDPWNVSIKAPTLTR